MTRRQISICAGALSIVAVLGIELACTPKTADQAKSAPSPASAASACTLPASMASGANANEQTAWQLFVAANCPVNGNLTWATWTEQTCLTNPSSCATQPQGAAAIPKTAAHHLHGSVLSAKIARNGPKAGPAQAAPASCTPTNTMSCMTTTASLKPGDPLLPFVPKNVVTGAQFFEEVFVNSTEASFVTANNLNTYAGQAAYGKANGGTIAVPCATSGCAVEVKSDWLPAASVGNAFDCTTPRADFYTETIGGTCYALVGIHISSKLLPNWLWATFEPQSSITNPNRCNANLYVSCNDPWGSNPATSTGANTNQTPSLTALMTEAGLPKAFLNYRLVGTQTAYLDSSNTPVQMGNSFVEFNAGVAPHEASCMTCHSYATLNTTSLNENQQGPHPPYPPAAGAPKIPAIGTPVPPAGKTWLAQDFSWMLGFIPFF